MIETPKILVIEKAVPKETPTTEYMVAIGIPIFTIVMLLSLLSCFCSRQRTKKNTVSYMSISEKKQVPVEAPSEPVELTPAQ